MGICASCISRDPKKQSKRTPTFEIQPVEFNHIEREEEVYLEPINERKEVEKKSLHKCSAPPIVMEEKGGLNEDIKPSILETEATQSCTSKANVKTTKRSRFGLKKRLKKQAKPKKEREVWTKEDDIAFNGINRKYEGDLGVLLKHFHGKRNLVNQKLISLGIERCRNTIQPEIIREDYIKLQGNWELMAQKYEVDAKALKSYFYGYVFQSILDNRQKINPSNIEIWDEAKMSTENDDRKSFFFENNDKEKGSPGLSFSKKGAEPSLSDMNDEGLVEEKISYLSARKEILESLNQYLLEGGETDEEGNLKVEEPNE